tara:strand:- start:58 stop:363 length:306 start_codon:yes stop_codon:yes gene_type:complete
VTLLVAAVAKRNQIVHIESTLRLIGDRNDVVDFGGRFYDVLLIAVLANRVVMPVTLRKPTPLRVIPLSMIQRNASTLFPALIARSSSDNRTAVAETFHSIS